MKKILYKNITSLRRVVFYLPQHDIKINVNCRALLEERIAGRSFPLSRPYGGFQYDGYTTGTESLRKLKYRIWHRHALLAYTQCFSFPFTGWFLLYEPWTNAFSLTSHLFDALRIAGILLSYCIIVKYGHLFCSLYLYYIKSMYLVVFSIYWFLIAWLKM